MTMKAIAATLVLHHQINPTHAYLPGVPQKRYEHNEKLIMTANALDSISTQLSFDYYSLPFCQPNEGIIRGNENLGQKLSGNTIDNTPYQINMLQNKQCEVLCTKTYSRDHISEFVAKIKQNYYVNFMLDNLPAAKKLILFNSNEEAKRVEDELSNFRFNTTTKKIIQDEQEYIYEKGYPLGQIIKTFDPKNDNIAINNHLDIWILHNQIGNIVGFEVEEFSINHKVTESQKNGSISCDLNHGEMIIDGKGFSKVNSMDITWTYSINFRQSNKQWISRWDDYMKIQNADVHWFQIMNSFMIVILLSASVGIILLRTLKKDLVRYRHSLKFDAEKQTLVHGHRDWVNGNDSIIMDDMNDNGWKLCHGDVFRAPRQPFFFAILIGSGLQIFLMTLTSILFSALGFLSPASRGSTINASILTFAIFGYFNGFYSARLFKLFGGEQNDFMLHMLKTSVYYPLFNFIVFFMMDLVIWADSKSTNAVPFGTLAALLMIWTIISVPMNFLGGYRAYYRTGKIEIPCETTMIPRLIGPKPWFLKRNLTYLSGGIVVFSAVFVECMYIMNSVFGHHFITVFGFLLLIFLMLSIISAQVSILLVYCRLCYEDYNWWYCSFGAPATSGLLVFVYSIWYFLDQLNIAGFAGFTVYFAYMILGSVAFSMITVKLEFRKSSLLSESLA